MSTQPIPITADLQALADEIALDTGCTPDAALALAQQQYEGLRLFAARWNAMARRSRYAAIRQGRQERAVALGAEPQDQE